MSARRLLVVVLTMTGLAAAASLAARPDAPTTGRHVVDIADFEYRPSPLTVEAGDTVVWTNHDIVPHTATAGEGGWDSDLMGSGESWQLIADRRGRFEYTCTLHPTMTGVIEVR